MYGVPTVAEDNAGLYLSPFWVLLRGQIEVLRGLGGRTVCLATNGVANFMTRKLERSGYFR